MYLTAHRVRTSAGEGVNAFLHLHRDTPIPYVAPGAPDIDLVSQLACGYEVCKETDVRPGGNEVLAYLDLVARDDVAESDLRVAVDTLVDSLAGGKSIPVTVAVQGVSARFGCTVGVAGMPGAPSRELGELAGRCLRLLPQRHLPPLQVRGPYVVWIAAGAEGLRLWLPPATLARLPRSPSRQVRMLIPHEALAAGAPVDLLRDSALVLLGLTKEAIDTAGGVELVDPRTARVLARNA